MSKRSRLAGAVGALLAVWVAVLGAVAGYAQTGEQRLAALTLVALTAGGPALAASKN